MAPTPRIEGRRGEAMSSDSRREVPQEHRSQDTASAGPNSDRAMLGHVNVAKPGISRVVLGSPLHGVCVRHPSAKSSSGRTRTYGCMKRPVKNSHWAGAAGSACSRQRHRRSRLDLCFPKHQARGKGSQTRSRRDYSTVASRCACFYSPLL